MIITKQDGINEVFRIFVDEWPKGRIGFERRRKFEEKSEEEKRINLVLSKVDDRSKVTAKDLMKVGSILSRYLELRCSLCGQDVELLHVAKPFWMIGAIRIEEVSTEDDSPRVCSECLDEIDRKLGNVK